MLVHSPSEEVQKVLKAYYGVLAHMNDKIPRNIRERL